MFLTQVLGDFQDELWRAALDLERVENWRQALVELHINDGADHGHNATVVERIARISHCLR